MASNALALVGSSNAMAVSGTVRIEGLADVFKLARALASAKGFVPKHLLGDENGIAAAILTGIELGLGPMEAMRSIHMVEGKPTMSSELMLARAIRAGIKVKWLTASSDRVRQALRLTRDGETHEHEFTAVEAATAGLAAKDVWKKYAPAMMRARCVSGAMRAFCPDVLGSGIYTPEELESVSQGASSGSPEVRILGDALHEHPEAEGVHAPDAALAKQLQTAMDRLSQCITAGDVESWVATWASVVRREPMSKAKADRWKQIQRMAAGVTPPVRRDPLARLFAAAQEKPAPVEVVEADAELVANDGEVSPAARAMDELRGVETRESAIAWFDDNVSYISAIEPASSEARVVWAAIEKRVGTEVAAELDERMR